MGVRTVRVNVVWAESDGIRSELDSHADTCVVGKHALNQMGTSTTHRRNRLLTTTAELMMAHIRA